MNYLSEILAFYNWLEMNPMPASAIDLWHALLYTANKSGWASEFSAPISILKIRTGLNKDAIYRARNTLTQMGLIEYRTRGGNQSAVYKLYSIVSVKPTQGATQTATQEGLVSEIATQTATHTASQTATQPASQPASQTATINKLNKTKQNKINDMPGTKCSEPVAVLPLKDGTEYEISVESFEEFVSAYPEINVLSEMRKMRAWCLSNPANRKTRRGIMKFINGWLGRAKPESSNPGSGPSYDYTGDETI